MVWSTVQVFDSLGSRAGPQYRARHYLQKFGQQTSKFVLEPHLRYPHQLGVNSDGSVVVGFASNVVWASADGKEHAISLGEHRMSVLQVLRDGLIVERTDRSGIYYVPFVNGELETDRAVLLTSDPSGEGR